MLASDRSFPMIPSIEERAIADYVAQEVRRLVAEFHRAADSLHTRANELEREGAERQTFFCWPFYMEIKDGILQPRGGVSIWSCEQAARHLAHATGKPVQFVFNDVIREALPGDLPR
jgi:hypothetical protein